MGVCHDGDTVQQLQLPKHWTKELFLAQLAAELQQSKPNQHVTDRFGKLSAMFPRSVYILAQRAMSCYLERDNDTAKQLFEQVLVADPYRLEHMVCRPPLLPMCCSMAVIISNTGNRRRLTSCAMLVPGCLFKYPLREGGGCTAEFSCT